jgi:DNA helicase-2/ATP-dependent DNA helicase PcrA
MLDKFVMNVTALNNYLKCPLEFYFKNLIRIPAPKNEATEFGSAVHFALERLFKKNAGWRQEEFPLKKSSLLILNGGCSGTGKFHKRTI